MIITRSPLRISLGGGGTDLPSYYKKEGGFLIAAAINKYVYISANENFNNEIILKYSTQEIVDDVNKIKHPIFRESLKLLEFDKVKIEIASMADIPSGTGLGSSGSFTTALLKLLYTYKGEDINPLKLAEKACNIEIDILKEPIGKQDQYISSVGGIKAFTFSKNGDVLIKDILMKEETLANLKQNLLLFYTGLTRNASSILKDQNNRSIENDAKILENLNSIKKMGMDTMAALESNDIDSFVEIMNIHWKKKKERSRNMSNKKINELFDYAINNGASSGKIIGAGGGGFLMFYANDKKKLRKAMNDLNILEVDFDFDFDGTKTIVS